MHIAFTIKKKDCPIKFCFMDSFQFLSASLEKLIVNLQPTDFRFLKENLPADNDLSLLIRKGVFIFL